MHVNRLSHPIFVNFRFHKNSEVSESIFSRWNHYGQKIQLVSNGEVDKIICIVTNKSNQITHANYPNLEILNTKTGFFCHIRFLFITVKQARQLKNAPITWVSGDTFFSFLFCLIGKLVGNKKSRIQIQFHGKPRLRGSFVLAKAKTLILYFTSRIAIFFSDSIRLVSDFQIQDLYSIKKLEKPKIIVAPIPIDYKKLGDLHALQPHERNNKLVYVGRLHEERGADLIPTLIKKLENVGLKYEFLIIGEGPLHERLQMETAKFAARSKIIFKGHLDNKELKQVYSSSTTLLSLAEEEGYGLAIREALLSGLIVIAKKNPGTIIVQREFGERIKLFNDLDGAVELIMSQLPSSADVNLIDNLRHKQQLRDLEYTELLVKSWLNLL